MYHATANLFDNAYNYAQYGVVYAECFRYEK